jgi:hypothetical protein
MLSGLVQTTNKKITPKKNIKLLQYASIISTSSPLLSNFYQQSYFKRSCDVLADYRTIYLYFTLFYTIIVILLPLIIVSLFNMLLIVRLYKSNDQWTSAKLEMHEQELSYKEIRDKKVQIENLKITWTLIIISVSFIFLTLPHVIMYFVGNFLFLKSQKHTLYKLTKITELFYIFNHSINFFLYVVTRNSFRRVLKEKLKCDCLNLKNYVIINPSCNKNVSITKENGNNGEHQELNIIKQETKETFVQNTSGSASGGTLYFNKAINNFPLETQNIQNVSESNKKYNQVIPPESYEHYWETFSKEDQIKPRESLIDSTDLSSKNINKKSDGKINKAFLKFDMLKKKRHQLI